MTNLSTIKDDFNTLDGSVWAAEFINVSGGKVVTSLTAVSNIQTKDFYTFDKVFFELEVPRDGTAVSVGIGDPPENTFLAYYQIRDGNVTPTTRQLNGFDFFDPTIPFDRVNHRWLRLRKSSNNVLMEFSPDGVTWSTMTNWLNIADNYNEVKFFLNTTGLVYLYSINITPPSGGGESHTALKVRFE